MLVGEDEVLALGAVVGLDHAGGPARCSTAASPCRPIRTCRARSTSFARPARPARRGTSRRAGRRAQRHGGGRHGAARQAAPNGRRHQGQPVPGPRLRHLDAVRRRRHELHLRGQLARLRRDFSAPKLVSTDSALCPNDLGVPTPQGRCKRTSSRSRSPGPTARCTSCGTTSTSPECGPARVTTRAAAIPPQRRTAGRRQPQPGAAGQVDRRRQHFSAPVKVADYYDLPDCATYQGARTRAARASRRRARQPTRSSGQRTTRRAGSTRATRSEVVITFGSYINRHSNESNGCVPQGFNPDTFQPL